MLGRPLVLLAALMALATSTACSGGGGEPPAADAGEDAAVTRCTLDAECNDGVFCNGEEICQPSDAAADSRGCRAAESPCMPSQTCDEAADVCESECDREGDADGDGHDALACGGDDCDDADPNRYPGKPETCDADHDEDCDTNTFGVRDLDGDDEPDAMCCNIDSEGVPHCGTDCDDTRAGVNSSVPEVCDGRDNDCDGLVDEGVLRTFTIDEDLDGFATDVDGAATVEACIQPTGYSSETTDCDDTDASIQPLAVERCDGAGVDENCDGVANPPALCSCTDAASRSCDVGGFVGVCAAGTQTCLEGSFADCSIGPETEVCDGRDEDCNGVIDDGLRIDCYVDEDNDGFSATSAAMLSECPASGRAEVGGCPANTTNRAPFGADLDCDDTASSRRPTATEVCRSGVAPEDEDCDGMVDEMVATRCYVDTDNDTYPDSSDVGAMRCHETSRPEVGFCPVGTTNRAPGAGANDCDDADFSIHPGSAESCNATDDDCDGSVDEGVLTAYFRDGDGDAFGDPAETVQACAAPSMFVEDSTDCDDSSPDVSPASAETCDALGVDENCNGTANEGCACTAGEEQPCGSSVGACVAGTQTCDGAGTWSSCVGAVTAMTEICNGEDTDCDGAIDDGVTRTFYLDSDGDGFGDSAKPTVEACSAPASYTGVGGDCDDSRPGVSPAQAERCDPGMLDEDCSGAANEGCDCLEGDTRPCGQNVGACEFGTETCSAFGAWGACAGAVDPVIETCNGADDDCDGTVDDGFACVQNSVTVGLNGCGRSGTRSCSALCTWLTPGFVASEGPTTCDYCDDTSTGIGDELVYATGSSSQVLNEASANLYGAAFGFSGAVTLVNGATFQVGSAFFDPLVLGHGDVIFDATMDCSDASTTNPGDGFALVVYSDEGTSLLGPSGGSLGVERVDRDGLAVEWRFFGIDDWMDTLDSLALRSLSRTGADPILDRNDAVAPRVDVGASFVSPRVRVRYQPDTVGTSADETSVTVEYNFFGWWGLSGGAAPTGPHCANDGPTPCGFTLTPGQTYHFGVSAATGGLDSFIFVGATSLSVSDLCE